MTPGARVAATIELLDEIVSRAERPADLVAQRLLPRPPLHRQRRSPRRVRARVGHPAPLGPAASGGSSARAIRPIQADGSAARHRRRRPDGGRGHDARRRRGDVRRRPYRPAPLDEAELRALRQMEGHSLPHPEQPDWVRLNVQEWVAPHLKEAYGEAWGREIAALETPPPVDLRVNRLKATVDEARAALQREGIDTEPMRYAPNGLRLKRRLSVVAGEAFQNGLVEIQDEGSQLVAALVDAQPGMQIADYCAGAGGKTLGHGRRHEQQGPRRRHGRLEKPPRPLGPAPAPRRRAQCRAPRHRRRQSQMAEAPGRRLRPRAGRRALHRHRHVAPKSRRPLDAQARGPRRAGAQAGRHPRCRGAPGEAGRRAGLRHLLGAAGRERAADRGLPRAPSRISPSCRWPTSGATRLAAEPPPEIAAGPYLRLSPLRHGTDGFFAATLVRKEAEREGDARRTKGGRRPPRRRRHDPHPPRPAAATPRRSAASMSRPGSRPMPGCCPIRCWPACRTCASRPGGRACWPIPARRAACSWPTTRTWAWWASAAAGWCATSPRGLTAARSASARSTRSMSSPTSRTSGLGRRLLDALFRQLRADGCDTAVLWMLADQPDALLLRGAGRRARSAIASTPWPASTSRRWPSAGATSRRRWCAASSRPRKTEGFRGFRFWAETLVAETLVAGRGCAEKAMLPILSCESRQHSHNIAQDRQGDLDSLQSFRSRPGEREGTPCARRWLRAREALPRRSPAVEGPWARRRRGGEYFRTGRSGRY